MIEIKMLLIKEAVFQLKKKKFVINFLDIP